MSPTAARSCGWAKKRLHAFAGGDLDARTCAQLKQHLRGCPGCRGEAKGWLQARKALVDGALCGLPASVDEAFFDRLHRQVLAEVASVGPVPAAPAPPFARWRLAAAAVLLVGTGWWSVNLLAPGWSQFRDGPPVVKTSLPGFTTPGVRPLAEEDWGDGGNQGLMARIKLRTLEREMDPAEVRRRKPAASGSTESGR